MDRKFHWACTRNDAGTYVYRDWHLVQLAGKRLLRKLFVCIVHQVQEFPINALLYK